MGQILLSLSNEGEDRLRRLAKERGGQKGALSQTVDEALTLLEKEQRRKKAWKRLWELSDNAEKWGISSLKREDGYAGKRFERLEKMAAIKEKNNS